MKVLHLINNFSAGGAELHLLTLCRHLRVRGIAVEVACLRERIHGDMSLREAFESEGIPVHHLKADHWFNWTFPLRLIWLMKRIRPDILHTHLPRADLAGPWTRIFYPHVPWISSIHDIHSNSWSARWSLGLFRFVWRSPDAIIAISKAVRDWLIRSQGIRSTRIYVVYYGIDAVESNGKGKDLRKRWGLDERLIVGTAARLEPRKGLETLIRAMPHLRQRIPEVAIAIVGRDPSGYGERLGEIVDEVGASDSVRFLGFQSEMAHFFDALDVFVFPSLSEGFGQVVVEAMASGKPVVVNDIRPLNEIVHHGRSGLTYDSSPEDLARQVIAVLTDKDLARTLSEAGRRHVLMNFSAQKMTDQTIDIYRDALERKARKTTAG